MLNSDDKAMFNDSVKEAWQDFRTLQGEPTIDVIRYSVEGDSDFEVLEGTRTEVPGLSSLEAAAFPKVRKRKTVRGLIEYEDSDMVFVIYDVDILLTDQLRYASKTYQVIYANYNSDSGRCVISASRI